LRKFVKNDRFLAETSKNAFREPSTYYSLSMIYFDHNATTPLLPEALQALTRVARDAWANASSLHTPGRAAKVEIETAREQFAALIHAGSPEIIFTGGGTEACNFALYGAARALKDKGRHLVASAIEHSAVKSALLALAADGWEITWVKPDADGVIAPEAIAVALRADTVLCAVMHANNEVGTVQPVAAIGALLKAKGVAFFCDMTQSLGKLPVDVKALNVDLASFAAHKIGGPKGAGALYVRKGVAVESLVRGGGQERGLRGGTENTPGIAGFGAAAAWWRVHGDAERARVASLRDALRDALQAALLERIPNLQVTAEHVDRLPNTLHVTFPGVRGDVLVMALDLRGIAVSAGSACASGSVKPSEVLLAMGRSPEEAISSIRFSLGFGNTAEEIPRVVEAVAAAYETYFRDGSYPRVPFSSESSLAPSFAWQAGHQALVAFHDGGSLAVRGARFGSRGAVPHSRSHRDLRARRYDRSANRPVSAACCGRGGGQRDSGPPVATSGSAVDARRRLARR
jgi:cysteine desulfurase